MSDDRFEPPTGALRTLADVAWPHRRVLLGRHRMSAPGGSWIVLPNAASPRLLLPDSPRGAAAALTATSVGSGPVARTMRQAGAWALRARAADVLPLSRLHVGPADSPDLLASLSARLPRPATTMAVRLGPDRPNQKPVVLFLDAHDEVVAFAKLGTTELTSHLVDREASRLAELAARPWDVVQLPRVLMHDAWSPAVDGATTSVLALSPLPIPARHPPVPHDLLVSAIREIAGRPTDAQTPLRDRVLRDLRVRLAGVTDAAGEQATELVTALDRTCGHLALPLADWHGDLRPWNVAVHGAGLLVWDWERSRADMPWGLDAVHWHHPLPAPEATPREWSDRIAQALPATRDLLEAIGAPARNLEVLVVVHLLVMLIRHLEDVTIAPEVRRPADVQRLLSVLESRVAHLPTD